MYEKKEGGYYKLSYPKLLTLGERRDIMLLSFSHGNKPNFYRKMKETEYRNLYLHKIRRREKLPLVLGIYWRIRCI